MDVVVPEPDCRSRKEKSPTAVSAVHRSATATTEGGALTMVQWSVGEDLEVWGEGSIGALEEFLGNSYGVLGFLVLGEREKVLCW